MAEKIIDKDTIKGGLSEAASWTVPTTWLEGLKPDTEKSVNTTKNSFEEFMDIKLITKEFLKNLKENNPKMYKKLFMIYINSDKEESFESFIKNNLLPLNLSLKVEEYIEEWKNIPCGKAINMNWEIINFTSTWFPKHNENHKFNNEERFLWYWIPLSDYQWN